MNEHQQKAEAYVREHCPELMETEWEWGQVTLADDGGVRALKTVGHPIQLQHWLKVLEGKAHFAQHIYNQNMLMQNVLGLELKFNLTTGQPATEEDYKAFNEVVGI